MKSFVLILVACASLSLPVASSAGVPAAEPAAAAHSTYYQLQVDGLACPFCAYGIEKKLHAIKGVTDVQTDIKSGSVYLRMNGDTKLDEATADQAVKAAGFRLKNMKVTTGMPVSPED